MSAEFDVTDTLDVQGANCPMPVVRTRQATDELEDGDVLEVIATDSGSVSDIAGWANSTDGVELLDQAEDELDGTPVYKHYVRVLE